MNKMGVFFCLALAAGALGTLSAIALVSLMIDFPKVLGATWWEAMTAIGTVGAALAAVGIAGWEHHVKTRERMSQVASREYAALTKLLICASGMYRGWAHARNSPPARDLGFVEEIELATNQSKAISERDLSIKMHSIVESISQIGAAMVSALEVRRNRNSAFDLKNRHLDYLGQALRLDLEKIMTMRRELEHSSLPAEEYVKLDDLGFKDI